MTTNRAGEVSSYQSKILVQPPHFFKVILFPFDQGLKIPDAFMRKYGRDLRDIVLLKAPTGASWQVELVHFGNGTRLQKGWPEFAKYHSIEKFYFLVFRYEGNSEFHVLIFDPTALEIEYPLEINCDSSGSLGRTVSDEYLINPPASQEGSLCVGTEKNLGNGGGEEKFVENLKNYPNTRASKGKRARVEDAEEDVSVEILEDLSEPKRRPRPRTRSSYRLCTGKPDPERKNSENKKARPNQDENAGCSKQKRKTVESFMGTKRPSPSPTSIFKSRRVIDKKKNKSYREAKAFRS